MKEATRFGAVWKGFRDLPAAPHETSPSSNSIFMVLLIFKEQQLDWFSATGSALSDRLVSVGANHVYPRTLALTQPLWTALQPFPQ